MYCFWILSNKLDLIPETSYYCICTSRFYRIEINLNINSDCFQFFCRKWLKKSISFTSLQTFTSGVNVRTQMVKFWVHRMNVIIPGKPYWRGSMSTLDLLVLTSLYQLLFKEKLNFHCLQNNLSVWGGQLYWAFPFSKSSLIRYLGDVLAPSSHSSILNETNLASKAGWEKDLIIVPIALTGEHKS